MERVLAAPALIKCDRHKWAAAAFRAVRPPEWILFAFLVYAPALAFVLPVPDGLWILLVSVNLLAILLFAGLIVLDFARPRLAFRVIRDWLALGMILLAYREMGWFALPHKTAVLESRWVVWDRLVLDHGARAVIESLGPLIPSVLEMSYTLVYALPPIALGILYLYGRMERAGQFLTVVLFSVLLCYAQVPFWPSEPPRVVFAGLDLPSYNTVFRSFNLWMLGNYGIHTSVFPSAHVAGALSAAFGLRLAIPECKWAYRPLFVIAALIAIATVYGRYHYLPDAVCGAMLASMAPFLTRLALARARYPGVLAPSSAVNRSDYRRRDPLIQRYR